MEQSLRLKITPKRADQLNASHVTKLVVQSADFKKTEPSKKIGFQRLFVQKPFRVFATDWRSTFLDEFSSHVVYQQQTIEFKLTPDQKGFYHKLSAKPNFIIVKDTTIVTIVCADGDVHSYKPVHRDANWFVDVHVNYGFIQQDQDS